MAESSTTQPDQVSRAEMFWFVLRRILVHPLGICGLIAIFIMIFYAVEDWRGKRAWQKCKAEFEARGEHLDWAYFIPPVMPDDENFFKTPMMKEWFQKNTNGIYTNLISWPTEEASWSELKETEPVIHAPNAVDYPASVLTNWFETRHAEEFKILNAACQRPKARLDGNYQEAWLSPIPNFVCFRQVAQILCARAQAYLKKSRPDLALQDLTTLRLLMDKLQASPTLVSSMIRVAIGGLYVSSIQESLIGGDWTDVQLEIIQQQLQSMDFLPDLNRSLRAEVAAVDSFAEENATKEISKLFRMSVISSGGTGGGNFLQDFLKSLGEQAFRLVPRGWVYQNMVFYTHMMADHCWTDMDLAKRRVSPRITARNEAALNQIFSRVGLFDRLAAIAVPNFVKAKQTAARNQTAVQLAALVCALERCQRAEGLYPEKLDELVPRFIEKLPDDLITGKPPIYRRLPDGNFLLYSVGWDEVDDGGTVPDWVWPNVVKW